MEIVLVVGLQIVLAVVFASMASSLRAQIERTQSELRSHWFALERRVAALEWSAHRTPAWRPLDGAAPAPSAPAAAAAAMEPVQLGLWPAASAPGAAPPPPTLPAPAWEPLPARLEPPPARPREQAPAIAAPAAAEPADSASWEQWIGVRGAAALGSAVLVLALVLFVRHSVEQGWLPPWLRVLLGATVSGAAVVVSQVRLRERYQVLASWLTGAGVAGLFAAAWAAHRVVPLLGTGSTFASFVGIAALGLWLAVRTDSSPIALLGAAGGFAAPLAVGASASRPGLMIVYALMLDAGLLWLALRRRWWSLPGLALLASAAYQAVWISAGAGGGMAALDVVVLLLFAALFGALPLGDEAPTTPGSRHPLRIMRWVALSLPLAFALRLVADPGVAQAPLPIGALLLGVSVMACVLAQRTRDGSLPLLAAAGAVAVLGSWASATQVAPHWRELSLLAGCLVAVFGASLHRSRSHAAELRSASGLAAVIVALGAGALLALAAAQSSPALALGPTVVLACLTLISLAALRLAGRAELGGLALALGGAMIVAPAARHALQEVFEPVLAAVTLVCGLVLVALVAAPHAARLWVGFGHEPDDARRSIHAGARFATLVLSLLVVGVASRVEASSLALLLALTSAALVMAWRDQALGHGVAGGLLALGFGAHVLWRPDAELGSIAWWVLPLAALTMVAASRFGRSSHPSAELAHAHAWTLVGAVAPLAWLAREASVTHVAWVFAAVAVLAAAALLAHQRWLPASLEQAERSLGPVTLAAASVAIYARWSQEWLSFAWGAVGLVLVVAGQRTLRVSWVAAGVAYLSAGVLTVLLHPAVLGFHPRGAVPVLNWISPTFLVPALACAVAFALLDRAGEIGDELGRVARRWLAVLALTGVFAWLNVAVLDLFAEGDKLSFWLPRTQMHDLAFSIAWGVFGTTLLLLGLRRGSQALRWASLACSLSTIAKVFLYDLGELRDLYRVAALVGLAGALLGTSLLYQRFVFGIKSRQTALDPSTSA